MIRLKAKTWKTFKAPETWTAVVQADNDAIVAMFSDEEAARVWAASHENMRKSSFAIVKLELGEE
jgi:hypothetical protein